MFRAVPLPIISGVSLYTQHGFMSYRFADSLRSAGPGRPDLARKLSASLYDIYCCCVYSEKLLMMDRGTVPETCRISSQNKFEKLVHLVGFNIRTYINLLSLPITFHSLMVS
jgi:hypothetical protein